MNPQRARSWVTFAGVGLAALGVFCLTLAPTVTAEDSGELIAAAWCFGVPHPPGYPLWTMLCGAFLRCVPILSVAARANLFSALCSAAAAVVACAALRQAGFCGPAAAAAALCWVWSRWSWSQSVITEVYSLNSLMTALLLWCALRWWKTRNHRPLQAASLLLGLGMCNHHTVALAAMALIAWVLLADPGLLKRGRLIVSCVSLFILGLIPYAYLPARAAADPLVNWGDPSSPRRFIDHVGRSQYGSVGPMKTAEGRSLARLKPQLAYLAESVSDDMTAWLVGGAAAGAGLMARRERRLLGLTLLWVAATGFLFVLLANYDLDRTSRWAMRVFLVPVSLGLVIPIGYLLDRFIHRVRSARGGPRWLSAAAAVGVLCVPAVQLKAHWSECDYSRYWYAHDHAENMLACMLPKALVFPAGDHNAFPLVYLVLVEGRRPDVVIADTYGYLDPQLYLDRPLDSPESPETWLINRARRPVYYATKKAPSVANAAFVPAGILYHLLPGGMEFDAAGLMENCRYRNLADGVPSVVDFGASHILTDYEFFSGLDDLERQAGPAALAHFQKAAEHGQGIKEVLNNLGSALAEHGLEAEAVPFFEQAAALDRRYFTPRWNLVRLFKARSRWEDAHRLLIDMARTDAADFRIHGELGFVFRDGFNDARSASEAWSESLRLNPNQPQLSDAMRLLLGPKP